MQALALLDRQTSTALITPIQTVSYGDISACIRQGLREQHSLPRGEGLGCFPRG